MANKKDLTTEELKKLYEDALEKSNTLGEMLRQKEKEEKEIREAKCFSYFYLIIKCKSNFSCTDSATIMSIYNIISVVRNSETMFIYLFPFLSELIIPF